MIGSRPLVCCLSLGVSLTLCGCGGGSSAPPPGANGNRAPGVAAVVGVDAGMGDVSNVPPASRPAQPMPQAPAASPDQAHDAYVPPADDTATTNPPEPAPAPTVRDPAAMIAAANPANADANYVPPPDSATGAPAATQPLPTGDGGNPGGVPQEAVQKGTPQYPIAKFFAMAKSGNYAEAEEIISSKARGLASSVRKGDLSDETVSAYQTTFTDPQTQYLSEKPSNGGMLYTFKTTPGDTATFTVVKEGPKFVIKELKLTTKAR